jgi:hypothetical protein
MRKFMERILIFFSSTMWMRIAPTASAGYLLYRALGSSQQGKVLGTVLGLSLMSLWPNDPPTKAA